MAATLRAVFKMIDNMSDGLNRLGNNGSEVIAGLEDSCTRLDSALLQVSKSSSQVSGSLANLFGDSSGASEQVRILGESADVLNKTGNEAKEYGEAAKKPHQKVNSSAKRVKMPAI